MKAKKYIETYTDGDYEFTKSHIINVTDITWKELEEVFMDAPEFEDAEDAHDHGVVIDYNGDVCYLLVNSFLCWIQDYLEENENEDPEEIYHDMDKLKDLEQRLEKYDDYDIYPPEEYHETL